MKVIRNRRRLGSVLTIALGVVAGSTAVTALFYGFMKSTSSHHAMRKSATPADARAWLARAGLDPRALVASGVTAQQTSVLVADAGEYLVEHFNDMESALEALQNAKDRVAQLEKKIRGGMSEAGDTARLATARAEVATEQAAVNQHITAMTTAGTGSVEGGAIATTITTIRSNRTKGVALQYMVEEREHAQWLALRNALASKRVNQRLSEDVPDAANSVITAATTPAVSAAAARLTPENIAAVEAAWNQAVGAIGGG